MIKELCPEYGTKCGGCGCKPCAVIEHCKSLYKAGYRKQKEEQVKDNKMSALKPCPFCGGKAVAHRQKIYGGEKGLCIKCEQCHARTRLHGYDCTYLFFHGLKNAYVSEETILITVAEEWNKRS